ncbi:hypothetical protein KR093_010503 [Drosophila rubida]|uniref:Uncharacterized protein n=1 Tax=Drosophila rubida TaxID=30044 RepID=A0AAD4PQQ3_9MUSC|nr:hypothetical protein KR093_010503 [Drosophila rubida]
MSSTSNHSQSQLESECSIEAKDAATTSVASQHVELALHTNQSPSTDEAMPLTELVPHKEAEPEEAHASLAGLVSEELAEELDENRWGRLLRVLTRCLLYCSTRVAAGFGLSRQQTAWYKHCWDNPGERPRSVNFFGGQQDDDDGASHATTTMSDDPAI